MKKKQCIFLGFFLIIQLGFIFLYLSKQEQLIALSYDVQKNETLLEGLKKKKEAVALSLQEFQAQSSIKKYAQKIGMRPMKLNDIRKFVDE